MKTTIQQRRAIDILPILLGLLFSVGNSGIFAQDELAKTRLSLSCTQMPESSAYLQARMLARVDGRYTPQANLVVSFYHLDEDTKTPIGKAITNLKGIAVIQIDNLDIYQMSEDTTLMFAALFEGNDVLANSEDETSIKRANIEVSASSDSAEKSLSVSAYSLGSEAKPIADYEILLSVPRMYSDLIIGEEYTDEDGKAEFVVPDGIPGDENGDLELKVRVIDIDEYGNLEINFKESWGIPKAKVIESNRELWTPNAPIWMVITFGFLIIGAWSQFGLIIGQLVKLKNIGKQKIKV